MLNIKNATFYIYEMKQVLKLDEKLKISFNFKPIYLFIFMSLNNTQINFNRKERFQMINTILIIEAW